MRSDLLEAKASIDWPYSQLNVFDVRLQQWLEANIRVEIRDLPPPATHNPVVIIEKEVLPLVFSVEAGAYINTIRGSLDILAMALVRRHNIEIPEEKVAFPIFRSEAAFRERGGGLLLQRLPSGERAIIEGIRPYPEGNQHLWRLHHLDIIRKHRRLLAVRPRPFHISLGGPFEPGDFEPLANQFVETVDEIIIGLLRKGSPQNILQSQFNVVLNEGGIEAHRPVRTTLIQLADAAREVIDRFDE